MRLAQEDPELRKTLESILTLDAFNRKSLLNTWLQDLRLQRAPQDLISALSCLLEDAVAQKALEVLRAANHTSE